MVELEAEDGTITIDEDALASITDAELRLLRISRQELHHVFLEGVELMRLVRPGARVRLRAVETLGGRWVVHLTRYLESGDPLTAGLVAANA
jgi:hypothetical protein